MRPTLNILTDELIRKVLDEAKRIMAETGMEIRGDKLRQRLLDHGLKTDKSGKRILFPADIVNDAIASTPKSFTLYNRDGEPHAETSDSMSLLVENAVARYAICSRPSQSRAYSMKSVDSDNRVSPVR